MGLSPTQRTIQELKKRGFKTVIVEKWNPHVGIRQDLFGIIDIIALDPYRGVVGIQTTGSGFAGHHRKFTEEKSQECIDWLLTPGTALEIWSWRKLKKKRGEKATYWAPRIKIYRLCDFVDPFEDGVLGS